MSKELRRCPFCAWNRREPIDKIVEQLEEASYRTESSFDEDGYSNDDAEEVVLLEKAIEIVKSGDAV